MATADLTGFVLELACWGAPAGRGLTLLDPPPAAALEVAQQVLAELGAVGPDGTVTPRGRALAAAGTHPRLARALLDGAPLVGGRRAAEVVAVLSDGDLGRSGDDLTQVLRALREPRRPGCHRTLERRGAPARAFPAACGTASRRRRRRHHRTVAAR